MLISSSYYNFVCGTIDDAIVFVAVVGTVVVEVVTVELVEEVLVGVVLVLLVSESIGLLARTFVFKGHRFRTILCLFF